MPGDRAHNTVPGTVHGPVTQVGTVHGDMHVHAVPALLGPSVDLALRIANSVANPELKTKALVQIAAAAFETDPERGEQVLALVRNSATSGRSIVALATSIARCAPERAARLVEPVLDDSDYAELRGSAAVALLRTRISPERAFRLVREAELDILKWADREHRDLALRYLAKEVAAVDVQRAIGILGQISPEEWRYGHVWYNGFKEAVAVHRDYALALFDRYFRALRGGDDAPDLRRKDLAVAAADVDFYRAEAIAARIHRPGIRVEALSAMAGEIAAVDRDKALWWLEDAKEIVLTERAGDRKLLGVVAAAAVDLDPALCRRFTQMVTDAPSAMDLYYFADSLAKADPVQAEQVVERALAMDQNHRCAWSRFLRVAIAFAEFDPAKALHTLNRIEIQPGSDSERIKTAEILIKAAATAAVWDPGEAKTMLNRAQKVLRAVQSSTLYFTQAWESFAEVLVRIDPSVVERVAAQMVGRDDVRAAMATGVAKTCASGPA